MREFVIYARAEFDIQSAYPQYDGARPGLGDQLLVALDWVFDRIAEYPNSSSRVVDSPARRAVIHRFPYPVYYTFTPTEVRVVAVLDGHQDQSAVLSEIVNLQDSHDV